MARISLPMENGHLYCSPGDPARAFRLCPWDRDRLARCTGKGCSRNGPNGSPMDTVFC